MTPEQADELERVCLKGLEMARDAKPRPPEAKHPGRVWIWRNECRDCDWPSGGEPFGLQYGDYTEAMLHGGTTIAGNLKGSIYWGGVTAFRRLPSAEAPWNRNRI